MTDQSVKKEKRGVILDAAASLFLKDGFFKVTMDMVAERAGVAKGTLYLYFKDKEELFCSVIRSRFLKLVGEVKGIVDGSHSLDELLENLISFGNRFVDEIGLYKEARERFMELPFEARKRILGKIPEHIREFNAFIGEKVKGFFPGVDMEPEYIGELIFTLIIRASIRGDAGFQRVVKRFIKKGLEKEEV